MSNVLPLKTRVDIAEHLVDGCSVNATGRLVKVTKKAILRFLLILGDGCARLHDRLVRNVHARDIEADEIWSFVHKKQHRCGPNDPSEWGDNYTFVAMARASKLAVSYLTGPRDGTTAFVFAYDLKKRLVTTPGRVQFSTDGFQPYIPAFRAAFGLRIDYGQVVKQYGFKQKDDHRYEPPRYAEFIRKTAILGCPSFERISTSGVERQNLTMRMNIRRLTRLTNGFSKKRRNLGAAIALHFMFYNFCRIHETLRCTPAMEAGIEGDDGHLWSIEELVTRALAEPEPPPAPLAPIPSPAGWREPEQLGLFPGLPGVLPLLLPPSTGGTAATNDNDGREPSTGGPAVNVGEAVGEEEEEGPATVRDLAPWGAAAPITGVVPFESGA